MCERVGVYRVRELENGIPASSRDNKEQRQDPGGQEAQTMADYQATRHVPIAPRPALYLLLHLARRDHQPAIPHRCQK